MNFRVYDPRSGIVPRLTTEELSALFRDIPQPDETWNISGNRFELYRVKRLADPAWPNDALRALLIDARGSYYIYGDRPPLDAYDEKAAIYFARAMYGTTVEWLSVRLVPPEGDPYGAGELDRFLCIGVPVSYWAMTRLGGGNPDILNTIPSSSRMCGLGPFSVATDKTLIAADSKHRFSAHCYALIRDLFLRDIADAGRDYRYLSGIIHDGLAQKSLTTMIGEDRCGIGYTPAHELLGFPLRRDVFLNRSNRDLLPYRFPTYWFNAADLLSLIHKLRGTQLLSDVALEAYCRLVPPIPEILTAKDLRFFGRLLTVRGNISGSLLTGKEIRAIIDRDVSDGPELKITPMDRVRADIEWVKRIRTKI